MIHVTFYGSSLECQLQSNVDWEGRFQSQGWGGQAGSRRPTYWGCRGGGPLPVRHKVCDDDLVDGDDEPDESFISDRTNKHHVRRCPTDALGRGYRHTVGRDLTSVHTRGKHIHIFIYSYRSGNCHTNVDRCLSRTRILLRKRHSVYTHMGRTMHITRLQDA